VITAGKIATVDKELAKFLSLLGEQKWVEASEQVKKVRTEIDKIIVANTPKVTVPTSSTASNSLPGSGYSRQRVTTGRGEFVISMISAPGARVIVETAGDSDCSDNCPTKTLAEHVAASGGFAGINGAYFCPPDYPKCQGKVNSFDTLAVNGRNKAVLNRANNVYSVVPLMAAYGNNLSFYDQTVQWGVDTSSTGALANHPRLVRDGSNATGDNGSKGTRGFIGKKDSTIVIGHVYAASLQYAAEVLVTLGIQNALNLDGGGSTALYYEGSYKAGPGRSLPTAIVLAR
jgi:exopolysaccharide biosynthesis protein